MVDAITPIASTAPSSATRIGTSTSITSEPDNAWVAARQSQITADRLALTQAAEQQGTGDGDPRAEADPDIVDPDDRHPHKHHGHKPSEEPGSTDEPAEHPLFSGESEEIGTWNFDEDTPFGERVAIV